MRRLPYDYARCQGVECVVREGCLRYTSLNDMGPRTPVSEQLCVYDKDQPIQNSFIPVDEGDSND